MLTPNGATVGSSKEATRGIPDEVALALKDGIALVKASRRHEKAAAARERARMNRYIDAPRSGADAAATPRAGQGGESIDVGR